MAARPRFDSKSAHHPHVGIKARQRPLDFAQLVVARLIATSGRPDLEEVVVAEVREVLFPSCGNVHEVLLIEFVVVVAVRPSGSVPSTAAPFLSAR